MGKGISFLVIGLMSTKDKGTSYPVMELVSGKWAWRLNYPVMGHFQKWETKVNTQKRVRVYLKMS
jgi:heme/copper-type cytochrome/quinol oxidase subunit 2